MTRKQLILAVAVAVVTIIGATVTALWPAQKHVFLETAGGKYRVISARYVSGTNLFANRAPVNQWLCQRLAAVGVRLKSTHRDSPFAGGVEVHAISVICENRASNEDTMMLTDPEYVDDVGRTIPLNHKMRTLLSGGRIRLVWFYTDFELTNLHSFRRTDFDVTNFCPHQLVLRRRSDHRELTRLDLSR